MSDLSTSLRRWIGDETFLAGGSDTGVRLLDDQYAVRLAALSSLPKVTGRSPPEPQVSVAQRVAVIEAMKMEHALLAPFDGTVEGVNAGKELGAGAILEDPLLALDPIYNSVPAGARERLQARFDIGLTEPEWALGYAFDVVLRGRNATPME